MHYNGIIDPFNLKIGDKILVPNQQYVLGVLSRINTSNKNMLSADPNIQQSLSLIAPPKPAPTITAFQSISSATPAVASSLTGFNIGFDVPYGLSGLLGFQLQVASDPLFNSIVMSRITMSSQTGWFYYDPFVNTQHGGYVAFPSAGIDAATYAGETVYYSVAADDPLVTGNTYYIRYCTWSNQSAGNWFVPTPITY